MYRRLASISAGGSAGAYYWHRDWRKTLGGRKNLRCCCCTLANRRRWTDKSPTCLALTDRQTDRHTHASATRRSHTPALKTVSYCQSHQIRCYTYCVLCSGQLSLLSSAGREMTSVQATWWKPSVAGWGNSRPVCSCGSVDQRWSNRSLARTMDGRIMCCCTDIINSRQSCQSLPGFESASGHSGVTIA